MFRPDRSPHADVGVKQDLLHMLLLSYNPVWLKLGLEVSVVDIIVQSPTSRRKLLLA